jgi:succinate--hydroxymethylglutarate CoA-transferase
VKHRADIDGLIENTTQKLTTNEWLDIFEGSGMPYAAVNDIQGTLNHEHGKPVSALGYSFLSALRDC